MQALAWRAHQYDEETPLLDWLSTEADGVLFQAFTHDTLARWLTANDLPSKYEFRQQKIHTISSPPVEPEKPLSTKERNVLLCIIAAIAKEAKLDVTTPSKTAAAIRNIAHEKLGIAIGESTIEAHLKKIPDALEARAK